MGIISLLDRKRQAMTAAVADTTNNNNTSNNNSVWRQWLAPNRAHCDEAAKDDPPAPPPLVSDESDAIAQAARAATPMLANPGPFEQFNMDSKRVLALDTFDGFRCEINKQVSPYMLAVHSFWLGGSNPQGPKMNTYNFLTQVADENGIVMARVDPGRGSMDGRVHRALLGGLAVGKLQIGCSTEGGQNDTLMAEMDVSGGTWMGNLKYGSAGGGLVYGGNYFQSITPRLAVGVEGIYMGANGALMNNYGLRYTIPAKTGEEDLEILLKPAKAGAPDTSGSSTFYASANSQGYSFNYRRVVTPGRVTFASELQVSPALQSMTTLGAEFKLARSKYSLVVDQSAHIQAVLEAQLGIAHGSPLLQFSAEMNPLNNDESKFGFGLNIQG